tara:strand:- start:541 stop:1014 length:474 start_codon:yes stop_codon:yes gene_type:complete
MNKKYITRRILDKYSEDEFSKELIKLEQQPFFPFKDTGIDIVGIDKHNNPFFYQLKARNIGIRIKEYWFMVDKKKLEKFPKTKKSYWVFCCFKDTDIFDFFIVPLSITKKWYKIHNDGCKKKQEKHHLSIKPISKGKYELSPKRLNKYINIMKYYLK